MAINEDETADPGNETTRRNHPGVALDQLENALDQEGETSPPPAAYIGGDTERYERIATVGGVFNRCVIYRGMLLHAPQVPRDFRFDPSPRTGRLTANLFLRYPSRAG